MTAAEKVKVFMDFTDISTGDGVARSDAPRLRLEEALETFLSRLPSWRGGQRENGRHASASPERHRAEASRSGSKRKPWKEKKERSRSRDRRRPSPVPVKSRGSNFDSGPKRAAPPGSALGTPPPKDEKKKDEKKEKKEDKDKDKKRDKDRDRDRDKRDKDRRRDRDASRSASNTKRKKDRKKEKERSRSRSSSPKARKESKLAEPPDWLPKSPDEKPKPVEAPRAPKSNPAPVPGEGRAAAPLQQQPAKAAGDVPDWLQDLFGGSNAPSNVAGPLLRPRVPHREVMVPQQCVARLIGKGGEVIMGICNQTGADVKIRQETKELGYSLAIITGHPDAMDAAERLVRQKLGLSGTGFASKELTVQSEHVPTIMGAKGGNLARIRQQAGNLAIELRPPDLPGMAHTAILGPGSQEQLMVAEQLIMATLAEAAVATAISNR